MTVSTPSTPAGTAASGGSTSMPTSGRWGWYRDHNGNEYRRVSKLLEYAETKPGRYNLDKWDRRQVAEGLALRDDLVLSLKAMGQPDPRKGWSRQDKDKIDSIVSDAQIAAKQRDGARAGTAVHDLTERLDRGEPLESVVRGLPALASTEVRAYDFLLRANGWRVAEIERTVQVEELEDVTGSLDREYEIPGLTALLGAGECQHGHAARGEMHYAHDLIELPVIGDVKTEAKPWLNGIHIAPQLAIYSRARKMWRATGGTHRVTIGQGQYERVVDLPNGEYVPAPCVRQDVAVVVHVHDGQAYPYFVRLDAGWSTAQRAYEQMCAEREAKREIGAAGAWFALMPGIVEPGPVELFKDHAAAVQYADPNRPPDSAGVPPIGTVMTVGGIDFVKHAEWPGCDNCAPLAVGASASRVDGTDFSTSCSSCGRGLAETMPVMVGDQVATDEGTFLSPGAGEPPTHEAVRGPDGLVRWQQVAPDSEPGPSTVEQPVAEQPEPHVEGLDLPKMLIAQIWQATTVARLSELWQLAQDNGVPWRGPVAMAGEARQRQIDCVQRRLHTGKGKCACGWTHAVPA